MSSFHISAEPGAIAETVLLPGDPLRAKHVAETMLEDAVCYSKVRNMFGFTGTYKGERVSIQGAGMGMGSASIYYHELINTYGVKNLVRVGTCGAMQDDLKLGDTILALSASGDSFANAHFFEGMHYAATADFNLLYNAYNIAQREGIATVQGQIFSTDTFYDLEDKRWDKWRAHGILAVEMESQALYTIAKRFGARALSILTVSDNINTGQSSTQEEREKSYQNMMTIGLELALS